MRIAARLFCLSLALLLVVMSPRPALAQSQKVLLTACNDTTFAIWVAVGEPADLYEDGHSKGWWKIEGGNCLYVGSFWTEGEGFYLYAQAKDGTYWGGQYSRDDYFCVDLDNAFDLDDAIRESAYSSCPSGFTSKRFRFIASPSGYGEDENFSYTYRFHM